MADTDTDTEGAPPAHGPAIKGKGKGKGLLNGPHREEIIVICSVIGVGLAFLTLRKGSASAAGTSTPSAALSSSGTSASLGTGSGQLAGGYSDGSAGLQAYLAQISDQLGGMEANLHPSAGQGVTPATPSPLAAGLLAPDPGSNVYARYASGGIYQVEGDGSLFGVTPGQWTQAVQGGASYTQFDAQGPTVQTWNTAANLSQRINNGAGKPPAA